MYFGRTEELPVCRSSTLREVTAPCSPTTDKLASYIFLSDTASRRANILILSRTDRCLTLAASVPFSRGTGQINWNKWVDWSDVIAVDPFFGSAYI